MAFGHTGITTTLHSILNEPPKYHSKFSFDRPLLKLTNFYRGFLPTIVGMIPYAGVSFYTFETLKQKAHKLKLLNGNNNGIIILSIGGISGIISQTVSYPIEVIRRQMQVGGFNGTNYNTSQTFRDILQKRGLRGFFVGLGIGYMKGI
jgi:solute carrier family 25 protein 16